MKARPERLSLLQYLLLTAALLAAMCLCVCLGGVNIPLRETLAVLGTALRRGRGAGGRFRTHHLRVRVPRVLCVALSGAGLSLAGACMQGLLRNPLADGSTLGVSSGAALGAVIAIAFGLNFPSLPFAGGRRSWRCCLHLARWRSFWRWRTGSTTRFRPIRSS